ncbi:MAG: peptidoglycan-binding protein, partial [Acidimicrobiales bacterium]
MDCIEGNSDACVAVGKEVAQAAGFPVDKIEQGIQNTQACLGGDLNACIALGQSTAVATNYPGCMEKAICKTKLLGLQANRQAQGAPPPENLREVARNAGSITLAWDGSADSGAVAYVIQRDGVPVGKIEMPPEFFKPINVFKRVEWRKTAQYTERFTVDPTQDYDYLVCPWHQGETLEFVLANTSSCAGVKSRSLIAAAERGAQRGGVRTTPVTQAAGSSGSSNAPSTPQYTAPSIVDGWPQLMLQTQGEPVRSLQYLLQAQGATLKADGLFGPETRTAVLAFQQAHGLAADGIVGAVTWQALLLPVQQGSRGPTV